MAEFATLLLLRLLLRYKKSHGRLGLPVLPTQLSEQSGNAYRYHADVRQTLTTVHAYVTIYSQAHHGILRLSIIHRQRRFGKDKLIT